MNTQEIISITIILAAVFAYINHRFIKWPPTIGIMELSLAHLFDPVSLTRQFAVITFGKSNPIG